MSASSSSRMEPLLKRRETGSSSQASASRSEVEPAATPGFEWDESKGTYVSVAGGGPAASSTAAAPATSKAAPAAESAPASSTHHRRHHHTDSATASAHSSGTTQTVQAPAADSGIWLPTAPKSGSSAAQVKVANTTWVEKGSTSSSSETPPPPKKHHKHSTSSASATAPASETPVVASSKGGEKTPAGATSSDSDEWVPKSIQQPRKSSAAQPKKLHASNRQKSRRVNIALNPQHASEAPAPVPVSRLEPRCLCS